MLSEYETTHIRMRVWLYINKIKYLCFALFFLTKNRVTFLVCFAYVANIADFDTASAKTQVFLVYDIISI